MPSCPANIQETKIAFGFEPQPDLVTANLPAELWSLTKTNPALSAITVNTESDAADIGKGDEFPTQVFPTSLDTTVPVEKYASSEFLAWLFSFSLGQAAKAAAGTGWTYTAQPADPLVTCINLPPFTYAEQIRTPPNAIVDRALVAMVVQDWTLTMESGAGRANCRVAANFVGTGKVVNPSGITPWPAVEIEHFLNASSATIVINGIDYIMDKSFIRMELRWTNNVRLDSGYFPGSGSTVEGYALRGRMEHGTRECTLSFTARAAVGSPELANLLARTEGPAAITLKGGSIDGANYHGMNIQFPRTVTSGVANGDADGIVTVECTAMILKPPAGVYCTMAATTTKNGIFGL